MSDTKQPLAYKVKNATYCKDCVGDYMVSAEAWSAYTPTFEVGWDAEAELNHYAKAFGIDRTNTQQVQERQFPLPIYEAPEPPTFCDSCLWWLS